MRPFINIVEGMLAEHYVNVHTDEDKERFADEVLRLLDAAYAYVGGHANYSDRASLLVNDDSWWKLVRIDGEIVAAAIYKKRRGRKHVAIASIGNKGKTALMKMIVDDIKLHRGWVEASGKAANKMLSMGMPPIPNKHAAVLTDKEILDYHGRFKYDRIIGGRVHTKILFGWPEGIEYQIEAFDPSEVRF